MTNTKDIIIQLKEVREEKGYSYGDILALIEKNGDYLSKSTVARVFSEGSEDKSFMYEETIRPIANALLDIENIDEEDDMDVRAMKSLLKYKIKRIEELEAALDHEKVKYHEKLEKEREHFNKSIDFLKHQIELKDKRIDMMFEAIFLKNEQHNEVMDAVMSCPLRKDED